MNQDAHNAEQNSSHPGDLVQAVLARTNWARMVLSPWVQRSLPAHAEPTKMQLAYGNIGIGRRRQTAFSEQHTYALLNRVARKVQESRVWRPDVGSVAPATFDRFASEVIERYRPISDKYLVRSPEESAEYGDDLTLTPGAPMGVSPMPSSFPSPRLPTSESPPPPIVQRTPSSPVTPAARRSSRTVQRPQSVRAFSRVEEITPGGKMPVESMPPSDRGAQEDTVVPERPAEETIAQSPTPVPGQPEPTAEPVVQRQVDQDRPTLAEARLPPSAKEELPAPTLPIDQAAPPEPPSPPVVQRQIDQEWPIQVETLPPPSAEEEPPSLPIGRPPTDREASPEPPSPPVMQRQLDQEQPIQVEAPPPLLAEEEPPEPPSPPVVQRQIDQERPVRADVPLRLAEEESPSPPASREATPARPGMPQIRQDAGVPLEPPVVQRQPDQEWPIGVEVPPSPLAEEEPPSLPIGQEAISVRPEMPQIRQDAGVPLEPPVVQRQPDQERPVEAEVPPPPLAEEEHLSPPASREATPVRPEVPQIRQDAGVPPSPPVVQRELDQEWPVRAETPPFLAEEEPSSLPIGRPPAGREATPVRPATPPVQRQVGFDEPADRLQDEIWARVASRAHMPLIEPSWSVSRFGPERDDLETSKAAGGLRSLGQTAILPQAQTERRHPAGSVDEETETTSHEQLVLDHLRPRVEEMPLREPVTERIEPTSAEFPSLADELPLPPLGRSPLPGVVQRQASSLAGPEVIFRQEEATAGTTEATPETGEESAETGADLDHLARQIYPLIKRMLAVERERRSGRWS